jgi:hypothetical protein
MLIWGWMTKRKAWSLADGNSLICVYKYFHLWFILRFITSRRWFVQGQDRANDRELTIEEVSALLNNEMPKISAYN